MHELAVPHDWVIHCQESKEAKSEVLSKREVWHSLIPLTITATLQSKASSVMFARRLRICHISPLRARPISLCWTLDHKWLGHRRDFCNLSTTGQMLWRYSNPLNQAKFELPIPFTMGVLVGMAAVASSRDPLRWTAKLVRQEQARYSVFCTRAGSHATA